jgi:hypothetical protein
VLKKTTLPRKVSPDLFRKVKKIKRQCGHLTSAEIHKKIDGAASASTIRCILRAKDYRDYCQELAKSGEMRELRAESKRLSDYVSLCEIRLAHNNNHLRRLELLVIVLALLLLLSLVALLNIR